MSKKNKSKSKAATNKAAKKNATRAKSSAQNGKRLGVLDAAVKVLAEKKKPMRAGEIVNIALAKGLWTTNGKTPAATLYSAMLREIANKGKDSRFDVADRGLFKLAEN